VRVLAILSVRVNLNAHRYSPLLTVSGSPSRYADGLRGPLVGNYYIIGRMRILPPILRELIQDYYVYDLPQCTRRRYHPVRQTAQPTPSAAIADIPVPVRAPAR